MSYIDTFITVAEDCPVERSEAPTSNRAKTPVHIIQYALLTENPYRFGHEEFIFETHLIKGGLQDVSGQERQAIWDALFAKGHPCLRASALTKRHGFGAHYNDQGKIALYPMESEAYQSFVEDDSVRKLSAMRSRRKK